MITLAQLKVQALRHYQLTLEGVDDVVLNWLEAPEVRKSIESMLEGAIGEATQRAVTAAAQVFADTIRVEIPVATLAMTVHQRTPDLTANGLMPYHLLRAFRLLLEDHGYAVDASGVCRFTLEVEPDDDGPAAAPPPEPPKPIDIPDEARALSQLPLQPYLERLTDDPTVLGWLDALEHLEKQRPSPRATILTRIAKLRGA